MKRVGSFCLLILMITAALVVLVVHPVSSQAQIWTEDKQGNISTDFGPEENVYIRGSGFNANVQISVSVIRPDNTENVWFIYDNSGGGFKTSYQLDGITGTYTVNATDGTNLVSTTFTDTKPHFWISIDNINGIPGPTWDNFNTATISLAGRAEVEPNFPGQLSDYQVQVNWGDNTVDNDSGINFVQSGSTFSGTWWSDPNHTYAASGTYTIIAKLYHGQPPGAESGDNFYQVTIVVIIPPKGSISGAKWNDQSYNGVWDPGEPGLPGWTIQLYSFNSADNVWINTDNENTGAGGSYTFSGLAAGNYRVNEVMKTGWIQTYPASPGIYNITLSSGENRTGINFGNVLAVHGVTVSISPGYENGLNGATLNYTVTVTNTGNASDNFFLTPTDNAGWSPSISPNSLTLSPGGSGYATLSVTIPSNATGGTRDNLTVTVTDKSVNVSASCTAQVSINYGLNVLISLSPSFQSGSNGVTLTYIVTITNTGNVSNTFSLTPTDNAGWSPSVPTSVIVPAFSSDNTKTLSVTIPSNAIGGTIDNITVTATGTGVSGSGSCTAQVTIARSVSISISPSSKSGANGATLTYTVTINNTGNVSDTYSLSATDNAGWSPNVPTPIVVPAFSSSTKTLSVTIPSNALGGTIDNITVTANGTGVSGSSSCSAQVNIARSVSISISPSSKSGANSATLTYTITVYNTGNVSDTYSLSATDNAGWSPSVPTSVVVPAFSSDNTKTLSVTIPSNATGGTIDGMTVTASGTGVSGSSSCTAQVTIARSVSVSISPSSKSGANGATLTYTVTVNNTGNVSDTYSLTATNTAGWTENVSPTITIPAFNSGTTTLSVTIPSNAMGGTIDNITVKATSQTDNTINGSGSCTAQVTIARSVSVSISPSSKSGANGTTLTYTVTVNNTGNVSDNYSLTPTNSAGWTASILPTSVAVLAFSSDNTSTLSVTIPSNAIGGTIDNITVTSNGTGDNASTSCTAQATISRGVIVSISPSSKSGANGATLTYTVTVNNTGNVSDTYNLTPTNTAGWTENVSPTITVPAFSSGTTILSVTIPSNATGGTIDNITVTATDNGVSGSGNCTAQVTITRGVSVSISPSSKSGANGTTLTYTVTVNNTGNVSDTYNLTPTNTAGWTENVSPTITIPAFSSGTTTLSVTVPSSAIGGTTDNITVTATDNGVSGSGNCTAQVTITKGVNVTISPSYQGGMNGAIVTYAVTVVNLGNVTDTYDLKASDNTGWSNIWLDDNVLRVNGFSNENTTTLHVRIPDNAVYCTRDNVTVTAISRTDNLVRDNDSAIAHAAAIMVVDVSILPFLDNGLYKNVIVTNSGNVVDSYTLTFGENVSWPLTIIENSVDNLMPGENRVIPLEITIPATTRSGTLGNITATATSKVYPGVTGNANAQVTAIKSVEVSISPNENWGSHGDRLVYTVTVKNTGNTWDNYYLNKTDALGWIATENFAWIPLAPDDNASVIFDVIIPDNAPKGAADVITVTATSLIDPTIDNNATAIAYGPNLVGGWNLVCFTGAGENDTPNNLFTDMRYLIDYVIYYWDAPGGPYHLMGGNDVLKDNVGYWIFIQRDKAVRTTGIEPASREVHLVPGWNLVGFPVTNENTTPAKIFTGLTYLTDYYLFYWTAPGGPNKLQGVNQPLDNTLGYWVWIDQDITVTVP